MACQAVPLTFLPYTFPLAPRCAWAAGMTGRRARVIHPRARDLRASASFSRKRVLSLKLKGCVVSFVADAAHLEKNI